MTRRIIRGGVGVLLSVLAFSVTARATTMRRASVAELARASDLVVIGEVVGAVPVRREVNGHRGIYTMVRLRVDEFWVGEGREVVEDLEFVVHGGRVGDDLARVHGQASFALGERVVVFLFRGGEVLWPTGMSQGKWCVDGTAVVSAADPSALGEGHIGGPAAMSVAPEQWSLARLKQQVAVAVQELR